MNEAADIQSAPVAMPFSDRVHLLAGDVEVAGGLGLRPDGDADVEGEGRPDDDPGPHQDAHAVLLFSVAPGCSVRATARGRRTSRSRLVISLT